MIKNNIFMDLSEIILDKIKLYHRGKENAIKRKDLLSFCVKCGYGEYPYLIASLTDRQLRNIYCQLPVATCEKGIFWPVTPEEKEEFRIYLRKKALPLFDRWKMFAKVHCNDAGKQMELF